MIRKSFDPVVVAPHPIGSDEIIKYKKERDKNGNAVYIERKERIKINNYVNSFRNGCSLANLLERCAFLPNKEKIIALDQVKSIYADVYDFPTNFADAYSQAMTLKRENPEIFKRVEAGEDLKDIIKDLNESVVKALKIDSKANEEKEDKITDVQN